MAEPSDQVRILACGEPFIKSSGFNESAAAYREKCADPLCYSNPTKQPEVRVHSFVAESREPGRPERSQRKMHGRPPRNYLRDVRRQDRAL